MTSVTVDATGTFLHSAAATSVDFTGITVGSGDALIVTLVFPADPGAITAVIWDNGGGNQTLASVPSTNTTPGHGTGFEFIYGLCGGITSGNKTLHVAWTNSSASWVNAISYTGVNSTFGTAFTGSFAQGNSATPAITITSTSGHQVLGLWTDQDGNAFTSQDHTQLYETVSTVTTGANYANGSSSVTLGVVLGIGNPWSYAGVDIAPSTAASAILMAQTCM